MNKFQIAVLGAGLVILTGCARLGETLNIGPTPTLPALPSQTSPCFRSDLAELLSLEEAFAQRHTLPGYYEQFSTDEPLDDGTVLIMSTDAINLAEIYRDVRELTVPPCAEAVRQALLAYMEAAIAAYEAAFADDNATALGELARSRELYSEFEEALASARTNEPGATPPDEAAPAEYE